MQSILKGTPTFSNHMSTVLYETYVAGQRNLDVYVSVARCLVVMEIGQNVAFS